MHIFNKILLALIFVTSAVYFVFLANRFKLGKEWEQKIAGKEKQIETASANIEELKNAVFGVPLTAKESWEWSRMGLIAKNEKLNSLIPSKVWTDCLPQGQTGADTEGESEVTLSFNAGSAGSARVYQGRKLADHDLLFVFDSGAPCQNSEQNAGDSQDSVPQAEDAASAGAIQPPCFLGTFVASEINPETGIYTVRSDGLMNVSQKERILASMNRSWIVYEGHLPIDSPNDIAAWIKAYPDDPYLKFSDEEKEYFSKGSLSDLDLLAEESAGESDEDAQGMQASAQPGQTGGKSDGETQTMDASALAAQFAEEEPKEGERFSVNYVSILPRQNEKIDRLSLLVFRAEKSKRNLERVICEQLAMIGCDAVPADSDELADAYAVLGEDALAGMGPMLARAKADFNSVTFIEQMKLAQENLDRMVYQRDVVKKRLDVAQTALAQMESRISGLVKENALLAKGIADLQFEASDQILKKADNVATLAVPAESR